MRPYIIKEKSLLTTLRQNTYAERKVLIQRASVVILPFYGYGEQTRFNFIPYVLHDLEMCSVFFINKISGVHIREYMLACIFGIVFYEIDQH